MPEEPILGGFHINRPEPMKVPYGESTSLTLMSDLHIGAAHVDYKLIEKEIETARENGDRVLINGDLLDLILAKDAKRYSPEAVHPRLAGRSDMINAAITWAAELLAPVAGQIDMIGIGNHETAVSKWHGVDPTLLVIYELERSIREQKKEHTIHYGGYTGFVDYRVRQDETHGIRWVLYYHHGSGASAPVTKGMIDFNRKDVFIDADVIWMGHKHNKLSVTVEKLSCPEAGDQPKVKEVRHIMTGAYFKTYHGQSQASVRQYGRRSNYAADMGLAPQGRGGVRILLTPQRNYSMTVQVVQ